MPQFVPWEHASIYPLTQITCMICVLILRPRYEICVEYQHDPVLVFISHEYVVTNEPANKFCSYHGNSCRVEIVRVTLTL